MGLSQFETIHFVIQLYFFVSLLFHFENLYSEHDICICFAMLTLYSFKGLTFFVNKSLNKSNKGK